jgi:hypothetical protein
VLGEPALAIHTHDIKDKIRSSQPSSDDKQQTDPVDDKIRRSLATISPVQLSVPTMLATRMSPVITVTVGCSRTLLLRQGTLPPGVGVTPASIQSRMNAVLRCVGPPRGSGGPGGPGRSGSLGGPEGPGGGPQIPQQPVMPAGDVKTMGQLPQVFTGDYAQADNFIEEVKGYLCLNKDVAGFNSPIKKITFTLILIKWADTAGWTCDMGKFLDILGLADNILDLGTQFLEEFRQQFQDT